MTIYPLLLTEQLNLKLVSIFTFNYKFNVTTFGYLCVVNI